MSLERIARDFHHTSDDHQRKMQDLNDEYRYQL